VVHLLETSANHQPLNPKELISGGSVTIVGWVRFCPGNSCSHQPTEFVEWIAVNDIPS
jgi:hypothetical protein